MERLPVQSSDLSSVGYAPDTLTLEIEFRNGGIYQYSSVPVEIYEGLINAGSKGTFFHQFPTSYINQQAKKENAAKTRD